MSSSRGPPFSVESRQNSAPSRGEQAKPLRGRIRKALLVAAAGQRLLTAGDIGGKFGGCHRQDRRQGRDVERKQIGDRSKVTPSNRRVLSRNMPSHPGRAYAS